MRVNRRHFDESGPGFHYTYDLYEFEFLNMTYVARTDISEPEEAHFLRKEIDGKMLEITATDLASASFREAIAHLREQGKAEINYLSFAAEGYVSIPPDSNSDFGST